MDTIETQAARSSPLEAVQAEFLARFAARAREASASGDGQGASLADGSEREKLGELTPEEQAQVEALKARDREVRDHEQAHARVGGPYAGEPTYSYQTGPDGRQYAVGGQVAIDVSPVKGDPEATIAKMEVVRAAALAPAEPSTADRQVAATAEAIKLAAIGDLTEERRAGRFGEPVQPFGLPHTRQSAIDLRA